MRKLRIGTYASISLMLAVAGTVVLPLSTARAATTTLVADLTGANESPSTGSPGTGHATVVLDTTAQTLAVNVLFSGLEAGTTASHIHCCIPPGGNAGVATAVPTFPGFPLGVTSGTYSMTFDLTQASTYNPAFVTAQGGTIAAAEAALETALVAGNTYLNIHTMAFPGGEIRGFLSAVPEPSTWAMMLIGFAGLGFAFRGSRRNVSLA
jgi:CHRD domain/PEP-CTERM motif